MKKIAILLLIPLLCFGESAQQNYLGFFPQNQEREKKFEELAMSVPTPENERKWLHWLTREPRISGTTLNKESAEYVRDRLKEFGLESGLVSYQVYLNHPESVSLQITAPEKQQLSLMEKPLADDPDTSNPNLMPAFHGYGASGDVAGTVVYANYGRREDYRFLKSKGISVEGKIVLLRYGRMFRGMKLWEAQQQKAKGVLIFEDPEGTGYRAGDVYPEGPMGPDSTIQRGSVGWNPGDPSTPGWPSKEGARRLKPEELGITKIPSLPISYGEAQKILRPLTGPRVPNDWQGGLPFSYHIGPGPVEVQFSVKMNYAVRPIWDVIGTIRGNEEPEQVVILGGHRDAWNYGAVDNQTSVASMLETARALGEAYRQGWRPRRTIIIGFWDAEEYGLIGSTEWCEDNFNRLSQNAVAYINLDGMIPPDFTVSGIPSLRDVAFEAASQVPQPKSETSVYQLWKETEYDYWASDTPVDLEKPDPEFYHNLYPGNGASDGAPFAYILGIPSLDIGYGGVNYGVYHSIYDNFHWMERFGDPDFTYHVAVSRVMAKLLMKLGGADIIPYRFTPYARLLQDGLDTLRKRNLQSARRLDPSSGEQAWMADFTEVNSALDTFRNSAAELDAALDRHQKNAVIGAAEIKKLNHELLQIERIFLDPEGFPKIEGVPARYPSKHILWGTNVFTMNEPWTFPTLTYALRNTDPTMFSTYSSRISGHLRKASEKMRILAAQ